MSITIEIRGESGDRRVILLGGSTIGVVDRSSYLHPERSWRALLHAGAVGAVGYGATPEDALTKAIDSGNRAAQEALERLHVIAAHFHASAPSESTRAHRRPVTWHPNPDAHLGLVHVPEYDDDPHPSRYAVTRNHPSFSGFIVRDWAQRGAPRVGDPFGSRAEAYAWAKRELEHSQAGVASAELQAPGCNTACEIGADAEIDD